MLLCSWTAGRGAVGGTAKSLNPTRQAQCGPRAMVAQVRHQEPHSSFLQCVLTSSVSVSVQWYSLQCRDSTYSVRGCSALELEPRRPTEPPQDESRLLKAQYKAPDWTEPDQQASHKTHHKGGGGGARLAFSSAWLCSESLRVPKCHQVKALSLSEKTWANGSTSLPHL